jgi:transposase
MAYQEHGMWEVLDVLRRHARGEKNSAIEAATGRTRKTVRRYIAAAQTLGWVPAGSEPDDALAGRVLALLRPGKKNATPGEQEQRLLVHRERITGLLQGGDGERPLKLTKIHQLLTGQGIDVHYSSLHRFAQKHCGFGVRHVTVHMADVAPGELAEVDFGRLGYLTEPLSAKRQVVHALIVTLVHSRHQYVHITRTQKLSDLIEGIEAAWEFFGGVAARVVIDNLKAAVTKPDRYEPTFQRTFEQYASHRGFIIDAAIVRHATGKPHVERNVQYVRENFFRGESWLNHEHVQREARRWCLQTAGTRKHGTTGHSPLAVFEQVERAALKALTGERFDTPAWAECSVHPDHHVQFLKSFYSVPTAYVGKDVTVHGDSRLVRLYFKGQLIKTHPRKVAGQWSTDYEDYPKDLRPYAMRDANRAKAEAVALGRSIGRFVELLLAGTFPWAKLRQAQKLLRLVQRYGKTRIEAACHRALAFDLIDVRRVERIVLGALDTSAAGKPASGGNVVPLPACFLRPTGSFTHTQENKALAHGSQTIPQDCAQTPAALGPAGDTARQGGLCEEGQPVAGGVSRAVPSGRD